MEKGLHVKIVKLRVGQAQLGGKLRRVRNRSSKRKRHSSRHSRRH